MPHTVRLLQEPHVHVSKLKMISKLQLDKLYRKYNRRKYIHPDPLEFLQDYHDVRDREIAGIIASALAFGRVAQILKSVRFVLDKMGPSPRAFIESASDKTLNKVFEGFKHRFATGSDLVSLFASIKIINKKYGSLNECFTAGLKKSDHTVLEALKNFYTELDCNQNHLLPDPSKGSACKRLNLFLRWMVRKDSVDPGGWEGVPASKLIIPLDTHMARIGKTFKLTHCESPNMTMALDITAYFSKLIPEDPVKYDFVLTRFGIRNDMDIKDILK